MDDENSQDELINHNTSLGKGKRAALWTISDDSDDAEEETEEGESDSGEEDEKDGHQYGEDEEDVEDDEEEEGEDKAEDGAFGGASAELAGMSSDEDTETCPICLNSFSSQPVATPENCLHYFCLDCILEWAKNANSCPVDRTTFESIYLRKCYGGKVKKMITVQKPVKEGQEERVDLDLDQTNCGVCGGSDREDHLLLCDGCDAGYHMECLTPPLDSVPVEEWFCPECEANNRHSRGSEEEHSDRESIPSTARPATSYSQSHATAPTRAIARTQQSERVRANVNRHRITQARTSQLAPTYLIQSTWLDETINAVVAGLNTSVYVRDFTPRVPSGRRRTTKKRRNIKRKKTSSGTGKPGSTGIKRRKQKVRRTKSRRKLVLRKTATPRSRIANNLGIVKDKKSSSLPTVYRPTEYTLSGMRANIGAASLSIYVDPFDLDPFVDLEEEAQQAQVTSLMEAKRRGISRSALRSHQPVARPVTASHSRRVMDVPQSGGVVEAAPVPDLLGSILSGQSMLLMDSSDVIINRDGSLKATKPTMTSELKPGCSSSSCSTNAGSQINPVMSPNHRDDHLSPLCNGDLPGFLHSSMNRTLPQITSLSPSLIPSTASHIQPSPNSGVPAQRLGPPCPIRHTHSPSHRGADRFVAVNPLSIHATRDSSSKNKEISQTHLQSKKAPPKPMWVDVSELPRIPKVKKESSNGNLSSNNQNRSTSTTISNGYGMPEKSMNSLAGDKGRLQSVEQRKGKADGQAQRPRPDASTSSSTFSNSFSSSSTAPPPSSLPRYSSSSSTSSAVSFRINSSGNSWRSRRLNAPSSSNSGGSMQEPRGEKKEEARKRRLHKDKQMLLASRAVVNKEQDSNNIYDPFNPTLSESSSSEDESECTILEVSSQRTTPVEETPSFRKNNDLLQSKQDLVPVKSETQETGISVDQQNTASAQATVPEEARCSQNVMVKKEPRIDDTEIMKQTAFLDTEVKEEQGIENPAETEEKRFDEIIESLMSQKPDNESPIHHLLYLVKTEKESLEEESGQSINIENADSACPKSQSDCSVSNSAPFKNEQKADSKSNFKICSKSPSKDMVHTNKASQVPKERCSSSPETDSGRRGDHHASGKTKRKKVKKRDQERSTRRSRSRDRRRAGSTSESSQSASLDKTQKKRERSRSRSKDRRRTRSVSSSSSRERSWKEKHEQKSKERRDEGERYSEKRRPAKNKRRGRSRSRSQTKSLSRSRSSDYKRGRSLSKSKSRSRSRSRERRKGYTRQPQLSLPPRHKEESGSKDKRRHRSRSSSRERRKKDPPSKSSQKSSSSWVSSPKDTKELQTKKKEKKITQGYLKEENAATVYKHDTSTSTTAFEVKHEEEEIQIDSHATVAEIGTQTMFQKEIKKEKRTSLDMFEDHPLTKPIKEEKIDAQDMMEEKEELEHSIKTEMREIAIIKSEPISTELCHIPSVTLFSPRPSLPVSQSRLKSLAFADQPNTFELTIPIKEEAHQLSGFDDEFNVDVMLDVLDSVKSESTDSCSVKQEKDEEKGNNERGQVLTVLGAKSKTQVKRVTWNIQEPEGPQPEKSASKVALYKLRLKQEGVRRPTSTGQTSAQEITGVVTDPSRKSTVVPLCSSSQFEGVPEVLLTRGQGEPEEGDLSRKDKYLRKLNMQERAVEEVKLAIKPFYQRRDISKDEYKEILRKAVQKVCHSKSGKINPVKVGNLVKAYVDKYKHARKHKKGEDSGKASNVQTEALVISESP